MFLDRRSLLQSAATCLLHSREVWPQSPGPPAGKHQAPWTDTLEDVHRLLRQALPPGR